MHNAFRGTGLPLSSSAGLVMVSESVTHGLAAGAVIASAIGLLHVMKPDTFPHPFSTLNAVFYGGIAGEVFNTLSDMVPL